ncbi:MAG: response regulator, partial [Reyranella sp.]
MPRTSAAPSFGSPMAGWMPSKASSKPTCSAVATSSGRLAWTDASDPEAIRRDKSADHAIVGAMSDETNDATAFGCDVLIIEDDPTQGEELACYLQRAGLKVEATTSASLAIHTIGELRPKVALIDYNLPDLDGVTV